MRAFHLLRLVVVIVCAIGGVAQGGALDEIYDEHELAALQPRYERGWRDNYDNALSPVFTDDERSRFANVRFRLERRVPNSEPFGFMAGGDHVVASVASIKFLEDVALAYTWLDITSRSTQSLADYLMMLRYWDARRGRPPKPLEALCIPAEKSIDPKIISKSTFRRHI